ncbi:hypothetical protein [Halarchaeum sp. P4]|uniref:hypothetical protein n=1 Tax=Halarchaeum sp. P4 TaxID=3421639 RepID=UPI003EC095E0
MARTIPDWPTRRVAVASLLVGGLHAVLLLAVALHLGYPVGPSAYSPLGLLWRYGGLVVVAALPVWLAGRFRLLVPVLALALTTGYVLGMELLAPGPTFRDVAELEGLRDPTGTLVVENGLYVVRYMVNASVWTLGFLFAGLLEATCRTRWRRLPTPPNTPRWLSPPVARRPAAGVAAVGGFLHAAVMVWFALRLGLNATWGPPGTLYAVSAVGMVALAAVPIYVLLRRHLVAPMALLTAFVLLDARAEFTASVDDPHALYFGAWFGPLALVLAVGACESLLRRCWDVVRRRRSA